MSVYQKSMKFAFPQVFKERFLLKFFVVFTIIFFLISSVLTVLFIRYQGETLSKNLVSRGLLLSEVLTYNSRMGVFSQNREILQDVVEGVSRQENVVAVSLFNKENKPIIEVADDSLQDRLAHKVPDSILFEIKANEKKSLSIDKKNYIEYWSAVLSQGPYLSEESLMIEERKSPEKNFIIGFSNIIIDKQPLKRQMSSLVYKSIITALFFWIGGTFLILIIVKGIITPLKQLTIAVDRMGKTGSLQPVQIESKDEIGDLARAFNSMSESLSLREKEKRHLETRLRQKQKMEAIGTLAGGIAHDFNNILSIMIGFSEIASLDIPENHSSQESIKFVLEAGDRAAKLVKQILDFSRQRQTIRKPINAGNVIHEAIGLLRSTIPSSIDIRQDIDETCGMVLSDETSIQQIIMNLSTNAVQAMKNQKGILEVSVRDVDVDEDFVEKNPGFHSGKYQKISVKDSGSGITPENLQRIFDPFFTTKGIGEGTGMGLSVVHGIILNHHGHILVDSEPGKGTRFDIYLPLIDGEEVKDIPQTDEMVMKGVERILFVDDEPLLVDVAEEILGDLGYDVTVKKDSGAALDAFRKNPAGFDLVITDMTMPHMSGLELSKELLKIRPDIPIILCTGFSEIVNEDNNESFGIKKVIMKPFNRQNLASAVRAAMDN